MRIIKSNNVIDSNKSNFIGVSRGVNNSNNRYNRCDCSKNNSNYNDNDCEDNSNSINVVKGEGNNE